MPADVPKDYTQHIEYKPQTVEVRETEKLTPPFRVVKETSWQVTVILAQANKQAWINESQNSTMQWTESLAKEVESNNIMRKLEERFWKDLKIERCDLTQEDIEAIWYKIFTLWDKTKNKLLAYINQDWEILYDMKNFDVNSFKNLLFKKAKSWMLLKNWRLVYKSSDWNFYEEGHKYFNLHMIKFYIIK